MRMAWWCVPIMLACAIAKPAAAIDWQEAVARLAQERTLAESCAGLLKKYGDAGAVARGEVAYGKAKAEYDGIIAGLDVALAGHAQPASLADLEARLKRGFDRREAFCRGVRPLVPAEGTGEKGLLGDIVSGAFGPLVDALKAILDYAHTAREERRKLIEAQLEAAKWPSFESVSSAR